MTARWCAAALIAIQLVGLLMTSGSAGIVALLSLATVVGLLGVPLPWHERLRSSPPYVFLAVLSVMKLAVSPYAVPPGRDFVNTKLTLELATYCIVSQILILFGWPRGRLPMVMPFIAGVSMVGLYNIDLGSPRQWSHEMSVMLGLSVAAAAASAVFFRRQRRRIGPARRSWLGVGLSLAVAAAFGVLTTLGLNRFEGQIEEYLIRMAGWEGHSTETGFTHQGTLTSVTSWRTGGDDRVAIRVYAPDDQPPGYLTGRVYARYKQDRGWQPDGVSRPKSPELIEPVGLPPRDYGETLFFLDEPNEGNWIVEQLRERNGSALDAEAEDSRTEYGLSPTSIGERTRLEVWPAAHLPNGFLAPPGATHLAADTTTLTRDAVGNLERDKDNAGDPYTLFARPDLLASDMSTASRKMSPKRRAAFLEPQLENGELDTLVRGLAGTIFRGRESFAEKVEAVERYFQENYRYELGQSVDPTLDPVVDFLKNRNSGHCELFASSTVMLLRAANVPARYATGLYAEEWNATGRYWLARDRDAHAWVEAFDAERGRWVVVESTPAAGVPQPQRSTGTSETVDWLKITLRRLREAWQNRDLQSDLFGLAEAISTTQSLIGIAIAAGLLAAVLRWRQGHGVCDPQLRQLTQLRTRTESLLARRGLARDDTETLADYARRVADSPTPGAGDAAAWMRDYQRVRYRGRPTDDALERLAHGQRAVRAALRSRV